jgi:predicted metalloprotease with PDZ domain
MIDALLLAALLAAGDETPARYRVVPDFEKGTFAVVATFPRAQAGDLEFWMPRWTAGAYHLADYGRFVKELEAADAAGAELPVARDGDCRFVVAAGGSGPVTLSWTAEACAPQSVNSRMILDVEGSRLTHAYGYLSPNSLLGFVKGEQDRACEVELVLPEGWRVATALPRRDDGAFVAPSWWRLEDSPFLFSPTLGRETFEVDGIPHEVAVHGRDAAATKDLAERCRKLAESASDWMQGLPYPRYAFLLGFVAESDGGSGLEHSESTLILTNPGPGMASEMDHLLAHEYFHAWCAERIHVAALDRPDYTRPLETGTIWVNEGITEYFCHHLLVRAGLESRERFFDVLWQSQAQAKAMWSLAGESSWTDVSRATPEWSDMRHLIAFSLKHYQGGCWTILGLDLAMRRASAGERGVADLLRFLDRSVARTGVGFAEDAMEPICEGIAQGELDDYFERYIDGPELPDLKELLDVIGYTTKGGLAKVVPLKSPTEEQKAALEDFFGLPKARAR